MTEQNSSGESLSADRFAGLLTQQRSVYQSLRSLSEQQTQFIASGDTSALLDVLGQRQQIVEQLTQINAETEPLGPQADLIDCLLAGDIGA